jgi:hypothetical protein
VGACVAPFLAPFSVHSECFDLIGFNHSSQA